MSMENCCLNLHLRGPWGIITLVRYFKNMDEPKFTNVFCVYANFPIACTYMWVLYVKSRLLHPLEVEHGPKEGPSTWDQPVWWKAVVGDEWSGSGSSGICSWDGANWQKHPTPPIWKFRLSPDGLAPWTHPPTRSWRFINQSSCLMGWYDVPTLSDVDVPRCQSAEFGWDSRIHRLANVVYVQQFQPLLTSLFQPNQLGYCHCFLQPSHHRLLNKLRTAWNRPGTDPRALFNSQLWVEISFNVSLACCKHLSLYNPYYWHLRSTLATPQFECTYIETRTWHIQSTVTLIQCRLHWPQPTPQPAAASTFDPRGEHCTSKGIKTCSILLPLKSNPPAGSTACTEPSGLTSQGYHSYIFINWWIEGLRTSIYLFSIRSTPSYPSPTCWLRLLIRSETFLVCILHLQAWS